MLWHEMMSRRNIDNSEALQACRLPAHAYMLPSQSCCGRLCLLLLPSYRYAAGPGTRITQKIHIAAVFNGTLATVCARLKAEISWIVQERRVIEYVSLGDFQTAVGFLLASTPDKSIRYYRDALCTLALAVSAFTHQSIWSSAWIYDTSWQSLYSRVEVLSFKSFIELRYCAALKCSSHSDWGRPMHDRFSSERRRQARSHMWR